MHRAPKNRVPYGRAIFFAMMALGAGIGYQLGCEIALARARIRLDSYARLMAAKENASLAEAHRVLNTMGSSRNSYCSEAEIAQFRELVFRSQYLKDAGRIRDGRIDCSAALGRSARSIWTFKPEFRLDGGAIAYSDLSPIHDSGMKREALQMGSDYVVLGTNLPPNLESVPIHMALTVKGDRGRQGDAAAGGVGDARDSYLSTDGTGQIEDTLYATRCSAPGFNCVTAFTSAHEALRDQDEMISSISVAGALAGILMGMMCSFLLNRSRDMSQQLHKAVEHDELQVVYQPIVNLETRQIVGAEALARWTDEEGNEVPPDVFVKLAEEHGFVGGITKTVLRRVLADFAMTLCNRPGFRISINVSAQDLADPAFLPFLEDSLNKAKVSPESVIIEITERSAADSEVAMETIRNLRRVGHSIHIDDFGTGYSNLDKLLYLFADTIKIDKAFTGVIGTESVGAAILPQILKMAKSLNLEVVVEGVETARQADYFTVGEQKIYVQGWLYGRPMTVEAFLGVLAGNRALVPATPDMEDTFTTKPGQLRIVSSAA